MSHHDEDYQEAVEAARDVNRAPAKNPIFCRFCGWKLVPNDTITEYNEQTGEPIRPLLAQLHCRNRNCIFRGKGSPYVERPV